jgi:hypothetical protein
MTEHALPYLVCFLTLNVAAGVTWVGREWWTLGRCKRDLISLDRKRYKG